MSWWHAITVADASSAFYQTSSWILVAKRSRHFFVWYWMTLGLLITTTVLRCSHFQLFSSTYPSNPPVVWTLSERYLHSLLLNECSNAQFSVPALRFFKLTTRLQRHFQAWPASIIPSLHKFVDHMQHLLPLFWPEWRRAYERCRARTLSPTPFAPRVIVWSMFISFVISPLRRNSKQLFAVWS